MSEALQQLGNIDGTAFCLVFLEVIDEAARELKLTPVHGTARVQADQLVVEEPDGNQVVVPESALPSILPSDGNAILEDAEHYVIVRMAQM